MTGEDRPLGPHDLVPDVSFQTFDGGTTTLSAFRGRPLLVVCVRYYG